MGFLIAELLSLKFVILKLSLSALIGILLGLEREAKHKPLGIKTCTVISMVSCLLTIVSMESAFQLIGEDMSMRADPMRLAAQIISGVGFIGAGVILRRNNDVISGLTTAAIVWAASGFGIAIGAGYYFEAIIGIILMFFIMKLFPIILFKFGPKSLREKEIRVNMYISLGANIRETLNEVGRLIDDFDEFQIKSRNDNTKIEFRCKINQGTNTVLDQYELLNNITDVERIEIISM
ncbi:MgtC/SapB family protein [Amphibacillus sp. Q70]|uniref:MgtC/SapB family protein n=1 Tax=Amphibacillus sp. Q70 TaxID=3453416 RepID=UPI003F84C8D0